MQIIVRALLVVLLSLSSMQCLADGTQNWQQTSYDDFSKGTAKGIAITSTGRLEMAPGFKQLFTSPSTYIWSIVSDSAGVVYVGAGSPARVYRVMPDGKATVIFEPKELEVQALAIGSDGAVYAATSPDGKVYRIARGAKTEPAPPAAKTPPAKAPENAAAKPVDANAVPVDPQFGSNVFFEPKTKYIWALAFDKDGRLYVATGDRGEIYRVNRDGNGSVFFKSDEAHIRSMAFDEKGNLIAGSDGSGLIYRITPGGDGFVIYSAPKKEITALAVDPAGNIYASGVGEKRASAPPTVSSFAQPVLPGNIGPAPVMMPAQGATGGSDIYSIAPDGSPKRLWGGREDIVYALGFDSTGRLLAGTGNKGRLVSIEKNGDFTDLLKASATQITAFAVAPNGLFVGSSNLGKVFLLTPKPDNDGTFESDVFDARIFSKWGRAELRGTGNYDFFTRSGNVDNPDRNWSTWQKLDLQRSTEVSAPAARFLQWRVVMHPSSTEQLDEVKIFYLPKNVPPVVDDVAVQAGARFMNANQPRMVNETVMVGGNQQQQTQQSNPRFDNPVPAQRDRGSVAVKWSAHDDNDDDLTYSIYYRGDGETKWKLLKDKITDKFYSWDSGLFPDGGYTVRVLASDAPSHTPEEALTDHRDSPRFEIDSTPPRVESLNAKVDGDQLHISFTANDSFSAIKRAEFSLDAGDWQFVEPVGRISDALTETYDFNLPAPKDAQTGEQPIPRKSKKKAVKKETSENAEVSQPEAPPISNVWEQQR